MVSFFSADGQWWWNGAEWLPTLSPDRQWRFNGHVWRHVTAWRSLPPWVWVFSGVWAVAIAVWAPIVGVLLSSATESATENASLVFGAVLAGVVVSTMVLGVVLAVTSQLRWTWVAALVGTGMQMMGYVAVTIATPQPGGVEDIAAGLGVVIFALPVLIAFVGLLWAGSGVGLLLRLARRTRQKTKPRFTN